MDSSGWELEQQKRITREKELQGEGSGCFFARWALALTGSDEKRTLCVSGGQKTTTPYQCGSQVRDVAFFPDGQRILTTTMTA